MNAVARVFLGKSAARIDEGRMVVDIFETVLVGEILYHRVEGFDFLRGLKTLVPRKFERRRYGTENYPYTVQTSEFRHRLDVFQNVFELNRSDILGNVVCSRENYDDLGLEVDDIGTETPRELVSNAH